jgi:ABC-type nitrate/sulfonate/bicarbonate transport system substrate-binding protein
MQSRSRAASVMKTALAGFSFPLFLVWISLAFGAERPLRIVYPGVSIGAMVPALAIDKGFFQQQGLQIEFIVMPAATGISALVTPEVDYSTAASSAIGAAVRGLPVKILMFYVQRPYHAIVAQKGIKSVNDLRGKTIATSGPGGAAYEVPRVIIEHYGMKPDKDVRLMFVGGGNITERLAQLEAGRFDATVLSPPLLYYAEQKGFPILATATDLMEYPQQGIALATAKLKSNPDQARQVIRVFLRTLRFIREQQEETVSFIRRWLKVDERVAEKSYEMVQKTFGWDGEVSSTALEKQIEIARQRGKATKEIPVSEIVDFRLLREARASVP